jgi:LPXTG-motif cell wall-anchored protein
MSGLVLSVLMIAGFLLVGGGIYMLTKRRDRTKSILMIVCGLVMWGNVAILTVPI